MPKRHELMTSWCKDCQRLGTTCEMCGRFGKLHATLAPVWAAKRVARSRKGQRARAEESRQLTIKAWDEADARREAAKTALPPGDRE
jgi:hypothetical protein